jgi:microcystin degradation protein MlrC
MKPSALIHVGGISIGLSSHPTYEWSGEQLDHFGIDYHTMRFVVAKNPMNYNMAYHDSAGFYILDTPGPTPPTCKNLNYHNLKRPFYPRDKTIDNLRPVVYRNVFTPQG